MVQPIDYMRMMPQTNIPAAIEGFGEALQARQKRIAGEELKAQYSTDLKQLLQNPSMKAFNEFSLKYPTQREVIKDVAGRFSQEQLDSEFDSGAQVAVALENQNPDVALNILNKTIAARKQSNLPTTTQDQIQAILSNTEDPDRVPKAQRLTNFALTLLNPEKFGKVVGTLEAQEMRPEKVREQTAVTKIKEAEAKFAPEKFGADLGLTNAQIEQAKAARRASDAAAGESGAKAKRLQSEVDQIAGGIIPADKRPEAEGKMRKEYSDQTKSYQDVKESYSRILASDKTAAGDLALIFNYMKMLDPGSVVRESEFATAENAAGVPDRVRNTFNKVLTGVKLGEDQRKDFRKQAQNLFTQAKVRENKVRTGIERIAKGYGLNPDNIFFEREESAPTAIQQQSEFVTVTAPNGQVISFPNQQAADAFKRAVGM